ncbi:O-unit flippase-like protein [Diplocloster modestus]|uniref:Polysaccharide biosynthesis protein n=1 Tax=Diplocloster modestus TaxID=2850322 RepID=A0ABS6K184_9FIRM|nr:O-unit flippase-like protein [Diplocloster modestus]MBU9724607.1 hypothetical protein [Diplocloster modestus]
MINIGKKDAIYSYINYFLTAVSNVIVLPFVLNKVSSEEYALWSVFLSIQALVMLIDTGFSTLVARYTTYAYCGAENIPLSGTPNINKQNTSNYTLVFRVFFVARNIYRKLAWVAFGILILGSLYIAYLSRDLENRYMILFAWVLFSIGVAIKIYFTYYSSFLKGVGHIQEVNIISISNTIVYVFVKVILVLCGWGILGIAIGNVVSVIITRILVIKYVRDVIKEDHNTYKLEKSNRKKIDNYSIEKAFIHNSKQLGAVVIANYVQGQGTTLICSALMPLQYTASYGLTIQLINVVVSLANIPFSTFKPKMNELRISPHKETFKNMYAFITLSMWAIFLLGSVGIVWILPGALAIIHSQTALLPVGFTILICLYQFIYVNHQRATDIIALGNEQPYARAYAISSIVMLGTELIAFKLGFGLAGFLCANLFTQLAYNGWKWPREVFKLVGVSAPEVFTRGTREIRRLVKRG